MPHALVILDGWGIAPKQKGNAITAAKTPNLDKLRQQFSYTELAASGRAVGLPDKQDGNSEAGHMNIGAGRIVLQEALLINRAISSGVFFKNPAFLEAVQHAKKNHSKLHLMGMLTSRMSAHAYPDHLEALLTFCKKKGISTYLHLFTDGRDAPPHEAVELLKNLQDHFLDGEVISTIMGRFYAMERNKRWEITEQAYDCLVLGRGEQAPSAEVAITRSYNRNESDEFIKPHVIDDKGLIADNDAVIFFNLRSDRARQITKCFVQGDDFNQKNPGAFQRKKVLHNLKFISMTDFGPDLDSIISAFPSADLSMTMPLALKSLRQLYIAESEKYAHVTYFLNGGSDHPLNGEIWEKIPSPHDPDYTKAPAMSATDMVDQVLLDIQEKKYDLYVINFANADMVGHSGNYAATVQAVAAIDEQIGRLWAALQAADTKSIMFITSDHGNAEEMLNLKTGEIDTEHSTNLVPFIVTIPHLKLQSGGNLSNILPTMLQVLSLPKPKEVTAEALC
ncbi:MAG: 2,3-bisphosphoglycerate-independent phosphoglycerate mutase [Patescibacteria group bacterium]